MANEITSVDSHRLRTVIIKIQDFLTEDDRKRLHFFFGSDISRQIRNDISIGGTLNLIDSLFDQEKITEQDFTLLITAFEAIHCPEALKLLKDYLRQTHRNHQSIQILPSLLLQEHQEDKYARENSQMITNIQQNMLTKSKLHPITITVPEEFSTATRMNLTKYLLLFSTLLILGLVLAIGIDANKMDRLKTEMKTKNTAILDEQLLIKNYSKLNKQLLHQLKTKLSKKGTIVAGGKDFQPTSKPFRLSIDSNQTIYLVDINRSRIIAWKKGASHGEVIAGGDDQLKSPMNILIDERSHSLLICDYGNRRIVRWSCEKSSSGGEILLSNIDCSDLVLDNHDYLYVSDWCHHQIKRFKILRQNGRVELDSSETIYSLDRFDEPRDLFIDQNQSIYISNWQTTRIIKWTKNGNESRIVADRQRNHSQTGFTVDHEGNVYLADYENNRVIRWLKNAKQGVVLLDKTINRLNGPIDLAIDRDNNLYVLEYQTNRVQKFSLDQFK